MITLPTLLLVVAALSAVVLGYMALTTWQSREETRDLRDRVATAWEELVMRRRDLRLAVAVDGTPTLHGRTATVPYTLRVDGRDSAFANVVVARAKSSLADLRLVVWPPGPRPSEVPTLPHRVLTGDAQFDLVLEAWSDDVARAAVLLDVDVRAALLTLSNTGVLLDQSELLVAVYPLAPEGVDDHAVDALRVVIEALGGPSRASVAKA